MLLFQGLNHVYILLLFLYLGLFSGIVYFTIKKIKEFIEIRLKKKEVLINKNLLIKKEKLEEKKESQIVIKKNKNEKKRYDKRAISYINREKYKIKLSTFINRMWIKLVKKLLIIFDILTLGIVIYISYFINCYYNYGYLRVGFVLVWIVSFFIGKGFINLVAKLLISSYNKHRRNVKKIEQ